MPTITLGGEKIIQIAKYFVQKANSEPEKGLDAKKLQKLLYYSQAWNLVFKDHPLFDESIEAWIHGPAVYKVWDTFKTFDFKSPHPEIESETLDGVSDEEKVLLDSIWNLYGKFDGNYLEALTHSESPWQEARKGLGDGERSHNIISPENMKAFYGQRLAEAEQRTTEAS